MLRNLRTPGRPLTGIRLLATSFAAAALLAAVLAPAASADRAYTQRFGELARGDVFTTANTILSCPTGASGCTDARNGIGSNLTNMDWTMAYVDVDGDGSTFNSSRADLSLPAGATVLYAGLYWGGDTTAGSSGSAAPSPAFNNQVRFRTPAGASYSTVTATQVDTDAARASRYQGIANVTAQVQAAGNGTYTVANIQVGSGVDRFGGWGLVVAYSASGLPVKWVSVWDGFRSVGIGGSSMSTSIALNGFQTATSGTVNTRLGMLSYEGELGYSDETATLNGTALSDAVHPVNNYFNSSITRNGAQVTTKSPNYVNQLGFDANVINAGTALANGTTTATVALSTAIDLFLPGMLSLVTDPQVAAPANTALPAISGTPLDGSTLTASPGTWTGTPAPTLAYQWQRCDAAGANCQDVPGATGATYVVTPADMGSTMRVEVTGTNIVGSATASSPQTAVVASPPVNTAPPSISGTPAQGETLTLDPGTWTGTGPITYEYQWQRCDAAGSNCTDIPGATGSTYTPTDADGGSTIVGVVTATNSAGEASATSGPTVTVPVPPGPVNTDPPSIVATPPAVVGNPTPGEPLTADPGDWTGEEPIEYEYEWQRCDLNGENCEAIPGATEPTYAPTADDSGHTLRVEVTATDENGTRTTLSPPTGPVPDDLGEIDGSLVDPDSCVRIVAGTGLKRKRAKGFGRVKVLLRASDYVAPSSPLRLSTSASGTKLKAVRYRLDGRTIGQPKRAPFWFDVRPSALRGKIGSLHKLAVTLFPRRGRTLTYTFDVRTRPCVNMLSVLQWKTQKGTGLRARVDSRAPLGDVTFRIPRAMLPKRGDAGTNVGRLRIFRKGGIRKPYYFKMSRGRNWAVMLEGADKPKVALTSRGAVVSNLPADTGIVELTLYTLRKTSRSALLKKGRKANLGATAAIGGESVGLSAQLVGKGR